LEATADDSLCLERNDLIRAWAFLALAYFELNGLAVIQSGITAAHLDLLLLLYSPLVFSLLPV